MKLTTKGIKKRQKDEKRHARGKRHIDQMKRILKRNKRHEKIKLQSQYTITL